MRSASWTVTTGVIAPDNRMCGARRGTRPVRTSCAPISAVCVGGQKRGRARVTWGKEGRGGGGVLHGDMCCSDLSVMWVNVGCAARHGLQVRCVQHKHNQPNCDTHARTRVSQATNNLKYAAKRRLPFEPISGCSTYGCDDETVSHAPLLLIALCCGEANGAKPAQ